MVDKKAKAIVKEYKTLTDLLKEDLASWNPRTLPGKISQHAQARTRLEVLKKDYDAFVKTEAAAIFVEGPVAAVEAFAKEAEEIGKTVTVDALALYKRLTTRAVIDPSGRLTLEQCIAIGTEFANVAMEEGFFGYNAQAMNFTNLYGPTFHSQDEVLVSVRDTVRKNAGDMFCAQFVLKQIVDKAFAAEATSSPLPCVILNASGDEQAALNSFVFGVRTVGVALSPDATEEMAKTFVPKAFGGLKKLLRSLTNEPESTENTTQG